MNRYNELPVEKQTPELPPRIIDYSGLVDGVQLSIAREHNLPGSFEATNFQEVLAPHNEDLQRYLVCEVGHDFDDALVNYVTAALIAHQRHGIVILAEESEGVNGYLPWQNKLNERMDMLKERGAYDSTAFVRVERYRSPDKEHADELTEKVGAAALSATKNDT